MYLNEGFDDYLSKPVNPAKLEEMIRHYLPQDYLEDAPEIVSSPDAESTSDAESPDLYSDFLEKMRAVDTLDTDSALANCGSSELLFSTIKKYHSSIEQKAEELNQYFDKEDWENYEIKVHALKSTSRLIGALKLSKIAEELEHFANNNQIDKIKSEHANLIELFQSYKPLLQLLTEDSSEEAGAKAEISEEELKSKVNQLIDFANDFDIDGLDKVLEDLSKVTLPLDFSEKFDRIRSSIENVDFKELRTLLSEWSNK